MILNIISANVPNFYVKLWWLSQQFNNHESSCEEVSEPWFKAWISSETELTRPDRSDRGQIKKEGKEAILQKHHHPCFMHITSPGSIKSYHFKPPASKEF